MLHHRARGVSLGGGLQLGVKHDYRMGKLIVKQTPGLVLVNGGFKYKQTDGRYGSLNIHSAAD